MAETIKIEIEIPAPPEGWGDVEYRYIACDENDLRFWNGDTWLTVRSFFTDRKYVVARKLAPLWTPPPQWHAMFGDGWLTRDKGGVHEWHTMKKRPMSDNEHWLGDGGEFPVNFIMPSMLPPAGIPWDKCCFKIGEPKE